MLKSCESYTSERPAVGCSDWLDACGFEGISTRFQIVIGPWRDGRTRISFGATSSMHHTSGRIGPIQSAGKRQYIYCPPAYHVPVTTTKTPPMLLSAIRSNVPSGLKR